MCTIQLFTTFGEASFWCKAIMFRRGNENFSEGAASLRASHPDRRAAGQDFAQRWNSRAVSSRLIQPTDWGVCWGVVLLRDPRAGGQAEAHGRKTSHHCGDESPHPQCPAGADLLSGKKFR